MTRRVLSVVAIFFGSMLLFGVQPMVGRTLLPFFGGTSAVWIVCLCAFQVLLLGGYFYAHRIAHGDFQKSLNRHLALLAVSALWAFIVASAREDLQSLFSGIHPALGVMFFLLLIIGLPYLALSANSSLVQSLASRGDKDVYHLYAVSNVGSLVGLFLYPFMLEPYVTVGNQWRFFGVGIVIYTVLLFLANRETRRMPLEETLRHSAANVHDTCAAHPILWIVLPALSCAILNAVTAHMTLDVIAMPLLWCILLALFLLSYVIGFSSFCARFLVLWDALTLASAAALAYSITFTGPYAFMWKLIGGCCLVVFGCSALHVRLYLSRPDTSDLTRYYLYGAIGGAVGGTLTGLVAPLVFTRVLEYPVALAFLLLTVAGLRNWRNWGRQLPIAVISLVVLAVGFNNLHKDENQFETTMCRDRGFFGTVRVTTVKAKVRDSIGALYNYYHGSTRHGAQFRAPGYGLKPTLYHTELGGGFAITQHPKYKRGQPMRVGIVGMGMGVSCASGRTNDVYHCWEISPEALNLATNPVYFTFYSDCPAKVETVLADARIALEKERRENAPKYDVLQIDAFSGDSAPYHLSTKEAFELYFDRLAPGGFLSVNISNWHIDFSPLIKAVATEFDVCAILYLPKKETGNAACAWGLFVKEPPKGLAIPPSIDLISLDHVRNWKLPSDECGSLVDLIRIQGLD